jgi:hypothetical protein
MKRLWAQGREDDSALFFNADQRTVFGNFFAAPYPFKSFRVPLVVLRNAAAENGRNCVTFSSDPIFAFQCQTFKHFSASGLH